MSDSFDLRVIHTPAGRRAWWALLDRWQLRFTEIPEETFERLKDALAVADVQAFAHGIIALEAEVSGRVSGRRQ
jgi:hypothetical protein